MMPAVWVVSISVPRLASASIVRPDLAPESVSRSMMMSAPDSVVVPSADGAEVRT